MPSTTQPVVACSKVLQDLQRSYDLTMVTEVPFEAYWDVNFKGGQQQVIKLFTGKLNRASPPLEHCLAEGEEYLIAWLSPHSGVAGDVSKEVWFRAAGLK